MGRGSSAGGGAGEVKTFPDVADSGWEFYGNGEEQKRFFSENSNMEQLIGEMDESDKEAFIRWSNGYLMGALYRENAYDNLTKSEKNAVSRMDDVLDKARVDKPVELVRLAGAEFMSGDMRTDSLMGGLSLGDLKKYEGSTIQCPSFLSSSAASQGLSIGFSRNVEYHIRVKAGTVGAGMYIGDKRINDWSNKQREFLFNRDSFYKVRNVKYDNLWEKYVVTIDYVGHGKHDYGTTGKARRTSIWSY